MEFGRVRSLAARCNRAAPRREADEDCAGRVVVLAAGHRRRSRQTFDLQTVGGSWAVPETRDRNHPSSVASFANPTEEPRRRQTFAVPVDFDYARSTKPCLPVSREQEVRSSRNEREK